MIVLRNAQNSDTILLMEWHFQSQLIWFARLFASMLYFLFFVFCFLIFLVIFFCVCVSVVCPHFFVFCLFSNRLTLCFCFQNKKPSVTIVAFRSINLVFWKNKNTDTFFVLLYPCFITFCIFWDLLWFWGLKCVCVCVCVIQKHNTVHQTTAVQPKTTATTTFGHFTKTLCNCIHFD